MLATKFHFRVGEGPNRGGNSRRWIFQEVEASLKRLNTDWIDLYQVHRPDPRVDIDETLGALSDLVHAGKIRYLGSSTFGAAEIVEAQWTAERRGRERFVCEQPPYSLLVRGIEREVLPVCERYGMGVINWSPLAGGWLSGRYRKDAEIPGSTRSDRLPGRYDMSIPENQRKLEVADALAVLAEEAGIEPHPPRDRLHDPPPGDHLGDHRPADDGAAREPARRRRRRALGRRCSTASTRSSRPGRT